MRREQLIRGARQPFHARHLWLVRIWRWLDLFLGNVDRFRPDLFIEIADASPRANSYRPADVSMLE
jgi:hypothetical protein